MPTEKTNPVARGMRWGRLVANIDRAVNALSGAQGEADLMPGERDRIIAMGNELFGLQQRAWAAFGAERDGHGRRPRKAVRR